MGIYIKSLKEIAYSDLTGRFPYISSRGNKCLLKKYDHGANVILAGPLKTRQSKEIATVWEAKKLQLAKNGHDIKYYIIDNKWSKDL